MGLTTSLPTIAGIASLGAAEDAVKPLPEPATLSFVVHEKHAAERRA